MVGVFALAGGLLGVVAGAALYAYLEPRLPSIESLRDVRLQVPLRVMTADRRLIAEFGEKRRDPVRLDQVPQEMVHAVLAAEDDRFYQHPGVDWQGLTRAVVYLLRTGHKGPGGSTITMQVARNFFLGREKTYTRKLNEILLALKIERELTKNEILELYLNKIFLGQRAYGIGAAAQVYYGRSLDELDLAQTAMIAGLPKAPSRFNPVANPERAILRRNYVLGRMHELGFIDDQRYRDAVAAAVTARVHGLDVEVDAPYVAEMVRADLEQRFGAAAFSAGYRVYTTIDGRRQQAATTALRAALLAYDERHGYRGAERHVELPPDQAGVRALLDTLPVVGGLPPALVVAVEEQSAALEVKGFGAVEMPWSGISWARPWVNENRRGPAPKRVAEVLAVGDVVRVRLTEGGWRLAEIPQVEGALVSLSPDDGAIVALEGGFDFSRSKFNRAVQAKRQPGSNFKPFLYSAALENGFTAASLINDAPVVFDDPSLEAAWRPENYSGKFFGPTRLRVALYKSRNLVSIRLLRAIGVEAAVTHAQRFGLDPARLPRNLSLALGSGTFAPLEIATGYAVFANGGYRVVPWLIDRIEDWDGREVFRAQPLRVCESCPQPVADEGSSGADADAVADEGSSGADAVAVATPPRGAPGEQPAAEPPPPSVAPRAISAQNAWIMGTILRDVVRRGTGRKARVLGRKDLAGKTGTTNDQKDAWFSGFSRRLVTTTWVGFDKLQPLGRHETGGRAALPMWIDYMRVALADVAEEIMAEPDGLVRVRIDPKTGKQAPSDAAAAVFETFRLDRVPPRQAGASRASSEGGKSPSGAAQATEQLF